MRYLGLLMAMLSLAALLSAAAPSEASTARPPQGVADRAEWLENMIRYHRFTAVEVRAATGLGDAVIQEALKLWAPPAETTKTDAQGADGRIRVMPYPGGRHPRLGFFDGAVDPQRDTKVSLFAPWENGGDVVVDVPEAIWSHLGLTYLAHKHLPTIWDNSGQPLEPVEWSRRADGSLAMTRTLPNGLAFGARVLSKDRHAEFSWWVRNGTGAPLRQLTAQACVMLGRASGFTHAAAGRRILEAPFAAASDESGRRWVITAWDGLNRVWQNPPVPCIHSDPRLTDCPPGETREARGWVWFHEGDDPRPELDRLRREFLARPIPEVSTRHPIPDKLVVLTFDDSVASLHGNVRPLLKELGFGATFFITEGFSFLTNKTDYMTWQQIAELHRDGFEVGNHTRSHVGIGPDVLGRLREELGHIDEQCRRHGIPKPISFAYPGNAIHPGALPLLQEMGFRWARRGAQPEFAYDTGRGVAYEPLWDHPLLIPTTVDARPTWTLENFQKAVTQARQGRIAVLQFHGVPDRDHPWVNTPLERFREYMHWLKDHGYRAIALRDLDRYVDPSDAPQDAWAVVRRRQYAASVAAPN
ncbi:MAG: polysaccharide deacetylase family protein [Verrucomicrobiota bacterium]